MHPVEQASRNAFGRLWVEHLCITYTVIPDLRVSRPAKSLRLLCRRLRSIRQRRNTCGSRRRSAADLQTHQKPFLRVSPKAPWRKGFRQFRLSPNTLSKRLSTKPLSSTLFLVSRLRSWRPTCERLGFFHQVLPPRAL